MSKVGDEAAGVCLPVSWRFEHRPGYIGPNRVPHNELIYALFSDDRRPVLTPRAAKG
jgi:hypothetical protein